MSDNIDKILLIVLTTFILVAIIIPFIGKIACHLGAVDIPGGRHIHKKPTPRLGGLGIFLGFVAGYMLFGKPYVEMNAILIGGFIIILTGIIDDIHPIKMKYKLLGQIIASSVIPLYGNILLQDISCLGLYINFGIFAYPITIIFILGIINCMNIIDGLDGLSGGISSIYYLTIGIIGVFMNKSGGLDITIAFIMLGSTLGFLFHNFHPAKIFAGDTGSMFMGYTIAVIALLGFKNITLTSFIIPLLVIIIPILDTFLAIVRRKINKKSITEADAEHVHHQLLKFNLGTTKTVLIIYAINILFAIASIIYALISPLTGMVIYGILFIVILIFVLKTNMLIPKKRLLEGEEKND